MWLNLRLINFICYNHTLTVCSYFIDSILLNCNFQVVTGLYDLISSNSDVDHPLCEECTDALLDLMDTTLSHTQKHSQMCKQLLDNLSRMPDMDVTALEAELENVG